MFCDLQNLATDNRHLNWYSVGLGHFGRRGVPRRSLFNFKGHSNWHGLGHFWDGGAGWGEPANVRGSGEKDQLLV